uniref:Flagellar protein FliL n=1 Tax=Rhizobium meliloti TaxID=382 RepID=Q52951_RHIML|nr:FliL [Sinorhizobium meliloti]
MEEIESKETKATSRLMTIAAVAVLTLVAGGGGWLAGMLLAPPPSEKTETAAELPANATGEEDIPKMSAVGHTARAARSDYDEPCLSAENWVRLEVALQFDGAPDVALAETIHQDIAAYLKTVSLQQIQGPRGFQYLRDDIQERVDLRSEGRVTNVMFRTFVIQ